MSVQTRKFRMCDIMCDICGKKYRLTVTEITEEVDR